MSADVEGTSGGRPLTSGGRRIWLAGIAGLVGFVVLDTIVNSTSVIDEYRRLGRDVPDWMPWTWEISSAIAWLAAMPLIALAALRLRPPRLSWPATLAAHLALTVPVSLLHVGLMVAMRKAVHGLMGDWYRLGADLPAELLYEWRKDAVDYLTMAIAFALLDWVARRLEPAPAATLAAPARLEVRDGSRVTWLAPADILWAEAAGNYVELHTAQGSLLHRITLAALERELAPHGFARIHRSRIVRRHAVQSIATNASGDFEAVLADGRRLVGSRRYRAALDA